MAGIISVAVVALAGRGPQGPFVGGHEGLEAGHGGGHEAIADFDL